MMGGSICTNSAEDQQRPLGPVQPLFGLGGFGLCNQGLEACQQRPLGPVQPLFGLGGFGLCSQGLEACASADGARARASGEETFVNQANARSPLAPPQDPRCETYEVSQDVAQEEMSARTPRMPVVAAHPEENRAKASQTREYPSYKEDVRRVCGGTVCTLKGACFVLLFLIFLISVTLHTVSEGRVLITTSSTTTMSTTTTSTTTSTSSTTTNTTSTTTSSSSSSTTTTTSTSTVTLLLNKQTLTTVTPQTIPSTSTILAFTTTLPHETLPTRTVVGSGVDVTVSTRFTTATTTTSPTSTTSTTTEAVSLSMRIRHLDFSGLKSDPVLLTSFTSALQVAIASEARHGVTPTNVRVSLKPGSVLADVLIIALSGPDADAVRTALECSTSLNRTVAVSVHAVEGINAIASGDIIVTDVSSVTTGGSSEGLVDMMHNWPVFIVYPIFGFCTVIVVSMAWGVFRRKKDDGYSPAPSNEPPLLEKEPPVIDPLLENAAAKQTDDSFGGEEGESGPNAEVAAATPPKQQPPKAFPAKAAPKPRAQAPRSSAGSSGSARTVSRRGHEETSTPAAVPKQQKASAPKPAAKPLPKSPPTPQPPGGGDVGDAAMDEFFRVAEDMGFNRQQAQAAMTRFPGDTEAALENLLMSQ